MKIKDYEQVYSLWEETKIILKKSVLISEICAKQIAPENTI